MASRLSTRIDQLQRVLFDATLDKEFTFLTATASIHEMHLIKNPTNYTTQLNISKYSIETTAKAVKKNSTNSQEAFLDQCMKLVTIINNNIEVVKSTQLAIPFQKGFSKLATSMARCSISEKKVIETGSYGTTSLVTLSDGSQYVSKTPIPWSEIERIHGNCEDKKVPERPLLEKKITDKLAAEAEILYSLQQKNPHIVRFFGVDEDGFSLLEYIPGGELYHLIRDNKLNAEKTLFIARALAKTLKDLHASGWSHCDIKPENIMFDKEGNPILIDFESARKTFTNLQERCGTYPFMAPEVLFLGLPRSDKIDVWSFGCTLYSMVTRSFVYVDLRKKLPLPQTPQESGSFLFKPENNCQNKLIENINNIKTKSPLISDTIITVLKRCLQIVPDNRASMKEIMDIFNT